jgi:DNA polymerase III delta' subunit
MNDARARLHAMIRNQRLPHGLLLSGPRSETLNDAALSVAQHLVCENLPEHRPCGTCAACRRVLDAQHPDVLVLRPEKQELTMEQIRGALGWIVRGTYEAPHKIAIFREAETLNAASSNALLKTLEEPPPHAILLLLTHSPDSLLPTVRSRLQHIRFFSDEDGADRPEADPPSWHGELAELLSRTHPPLSREIFELTEKIAKDRSELGHFFALFEKHLRDKLRGTGSRRAEAAFDHALKAEQDILHHYGNVSLVLDRLLLDYFADVH